MGKQGFGRWLLVVTWAVIIQHASGSGKLDIKFVSFKGNGKGSNGNCCESIVSWIGCSNQCDPYFTLCLDRLGGPRTVKRSTSHMDQCSIKKSTTGVFDGQNSITFGSHLGNNMPNPYLISQTTVTNDFNIKIRVQDHDDNNHDHIDDMLSGVSNLIPRFNGKKGGYRHVTLQSSERAEVLLEVRSFCDVFYYGNDCTTWCKPNELDHYTCDPDGKKKCDPGWKGDNCDEDVDECLTDRCKHGANCTNLPGSFLCTCTEGYSGFFCEESANKCDVNPCLNGGSCHMNEMSELVCDCLPWWGDKHCDKAVNPCDAKPCRNNATCLANNASTTGFVCSCEFGWTGAICDSTTNSTTTSTTSTPTTPTTPTTTVFTVSYGDPYRITLLGVIDQYNRPSLDDGLIRIIKELGGIKEKVYVKVKPKVVPIKDGVTLTYVEFHSGSEGGAINSSTVDDIFKYYSDDRINTYLPLPLYRPVVESSPQKQVQHRGDWFSGHWYMVVVPILIAIILVVCIAAFLLITRRRKKEKAAAFLRCESNVEPTSPTNMAFENVLYHETHQQRQSNVLDGGEVTLNPDESARAGALHQMGACADEPNPYSQPVQYDTPLKQPECACNGVSQYQNSNLATLDTRCDAGYNDYTDFNDLEGAKAKEDNHYQELDDVLAQKVALSVGLPEERDGNVSADDTDDEDEIDKIKASFKEETNA